MREVNLIMNKLALGILTLVFGIMLFTQQAKADVIWEPKDSFYKTNSSECEYINRLYTANGPDKAVVVYKSPENPGIVRKYENGTEIRILHTYMDKNGVEWGIYEENSQTGWVPMDYLKPVYDYICFEEEFGDKIVEEEGALDKKYKGLQIYFWNAPGSSRGYTRVIGDYTPEYVKTYVDEMGRKWGYTFYYMGSRNLWFCLDDPRADFDTLWPDEEPVLGDGQDETVYDSDRIVPGGSKTGGMGLSIFISVVLVTMVIIITLRLLKKLKTEVM